VKPLSLSTPDAKHLRIDGISPLLAMCLQELPAILEKRDSSAARHRLFPDPTRADAKANDDWQQHVAPELRHLFVSAGETVVRDLTALTGETLTFPAEHANAWMSALNQARLILGELHEITDHDMDPDNLDPRIPKQRAVLLIHLYGYLLQLFVDHEQPGSV